MRLLVWGIGIFLLFSVFLSCGNNNTYRHYLNKAEELLEEYPDSALKYLDSIITPNILAKEYFDDYHLLMIRSKIKVGKDITNDTILFSLRGYYDKSNPDKAAAIYFNSGKIFELQGKYEEALNNYLDAEKNVSPVNYKLKGNIYHSLGNLFFRKREMVEARNYFLISIHNYHTCNELLNTVTVYNLMGNCHIIENNLDSAYYYYEKCINLLDKVDNHLFKPLLLNNLAVGYRVAGDTIKAKTFLYESLTYPVSNQEKSRIFHNLAKNNYYNKDSFYYYMNQSFEFLEDHDDSASKASLYLSFSIFEEDSGRDDMALKYYKEHVKHLRDLHEKDYESTLSVLQYKFQKRGVEQENMQLLIHRQRLVILGVCLFILLLLSIVYVYRKKKAIEDIEKNLEHLKKMSELYSQKEKSLKNIVLQNFNILKKVALMENYMINNESNAKLIKKFNEIIYNSKTKEWEQLYQTMNALKNNLFDNLKTSFPQLEENEFRICCLSIAKFTNIEIGLLMNYSINTINAKKNIIRKKMGVKPMGNIEEFLLSYFKEKKVDI